MTTIQILSPSYRDVDRIRLRHIARYNGHRCHVDVCLRHGSIAASQPTPVVPFLNVDLAQGWYVAATSAILYGLTMLTGTLYFWYVRCAI